MSARLGGAGAGVVTPTELAAAVESLRRAGGLYELIAACVERDGEGEITQ